MRWGHQNHTVSHIRSAGPAGLRRDRVIVSDNPLPITLRIMGLSRYPLYMSNKAADGLV